MSTESINRKKVLLVAFTKWDVTNLIPVINKCKQNGNDIAVLGIDFDSWLELRERKIPYKTPAAYFDKTKCSAIDSEALHLAKSWYKPLDSQLTYHEVCLGEMAEYDFIFLFIDALRSIDIASSIIEIESPDEVWITQNVPVNNPSAARYQALPSAINAVAKIKGVNVCYNNLETKAVENKSSFVRNTASSALNKMRKIRLKAKNALNQGEVALIDLPNEISRSLTNQLKTYQYSTIDLSAPTLVDCGNVTLSCNFTEMINDFKNSKIGNITHRGVLIYDILVGSFSHFFSVAFPKLINCVDGTEKFVTNAHPKLVVVMCDTPAVYRTIAKVCKLKGVPTLVIQHGATSADMNGFHVMPLEADKQAVWGTASKEWALKRGKPPETQVITGNPRYDSIVTGKSKEKEKFKIYDELGLDRQKGIVVIATSWYAGVASSFSPEDVEDFILQTLKAMKQFPEKQVVVKLHPADFETYNKLTKKISDELNIGIFITRRYLWELLGMCELLITHTSTVGLEAMLLNKPVVTFYSKDISSLVPYNATAAVVKVNEAAELVFAIRNALYDKDIRIELEKAGQQFIYQYAYLQDGKASQRVAKLIRKMIVENSVQGNLQKK